MTNSNQTESKVTDAREIILQECYAIADGKTMMRGTTAHVKALVEALRTQGGAQ